MDRNSEPTSEVEHGPIAAPTPASCEHLRQRADALLRLKVRLSLRKDFGTRVWAVPVTPSLRMDPHARLCRGAACLLEYVLASAVRVRQRLGLNAFLASCRAQVEHEMSLRMSRQQSLPRHFRNQTPTRT